MTTNHQSLPPADLAKRIYVCACAQLLGVLGIEYFLFDSEDFNAPEGGIPLQHYYGSDEDGNIHEWLSNEYLDYWELRADARDAEDQMDQLTALWLPKLWQVAKELHRAHPPLASNGQLLQLLYYRAVIRSLEVFDQLFSHDPLKGTEFQHRYDAEGHVFVHQTISSLWNTVPLQQIAFSETTLNALVDNHGAELATVYESNVMQAAQAVW